MGLDIPYERGGEASNSFLVPSFGLLASLSLVNGFKTVNKFGESPNCDQNVPTDIWAGSTAGIATPIWVPPTEARVHNLVSGSADDAAAGDGVRTVRVYGLKTWDEEETSEVVAMNGLTNVPTENSYVIIHRMVALTWGPLGKAQGNITATAVVDNTITALILAGFNQTQICIYGVPSTQKLRVSRVICSIVKGNGTSQRADGDVLVMTDPATNAPHNTAWTSRERFLVVEGRLPWTHSYEQEPKQFDGPCIVKIQVSANADDVKCIGAFDGTLVRISDS